MTQEQRIDELERQCRRSRRAGMAVLMTALMALVACVGLLAASRAGAQGVPQPNVVTGGEFRLVDDKGATRALLALENDGPVLRFLDKQDKIRVSVLLSEQGSGLVFTRENGRPGASIGLGPLGPAMAFGDSGGHVRFLLTANDTSAAKLVLKDTAGHVAWTAP